jgi:DNA (cytosine-5)-methyltransferase 1
MAEYKQTFYEFFAGGGMARLGLGKKWKCLFANEFCPKKAESYRTNHRPDGELVMDDVANITIDDLPGRATLSWASFPCQDLSLAGKGRGLNGSRSGTFWPFWDLMSGLSDVGRPVPIIVLENVVGALSSNNGRDFRAITDALIHKSYVFGPMVIDAVRFLPQSRPRLFIVAVKSDIDFDNFVSDNPVDPWHTKRILQAYGSLDDVRKRYWVWWNLKVPEPINYDLSKIVENNPDSVKWHTKSVTDRLLDMMSGPNRQKVKEIQVRNRLIVGTVYKRTRQIENGKHVQRAEVRFDQISGCLRTPTGGSSRQIVMIVNGREIRTRLLSAREAARLIGLPDSYKLPERYNDAYHLAGDGLAIPVVSWLEKHLLTPLSSKIE